APSVWLNALASVRAMPRCRVTPLKEGRRVLTRQLDVVLHPLDAHGVDAPFLPAYDFFAATQVVRRVVVTSVLVAWWKRLVMRGGGAVAGSSTAATLWVHGEASVFVDCFVHQLVYWCGWVGVWWASSGVGGCVR
ncbi:hypothetical protein TraAM80_09055, partial [Trypanosoma rangeli]